jgi:hypothetical protein
MEFESENVWGVAERRRGEHGGPAPYAVSNPNTLSIPEQVIFVVPLLAGYEKAEGKMQKAVRTPTRLQPITNK